LVAVTGVIDAGGPELLVSAKVAESDGFAVAVTLYPPSTLLAVGATEVVAMPFAPVVAVATLLPLTNVAPALGEAGDVNVTVTPETGFPPESFTNTLNGFVNCTPTAAP